MTSGFHFVDISSDGGNVAASVFLLEEKRNASVRAC